LEIHGNSGAGDAAAEYLESIEIAYRYIEVEILVHLIESGIVIN
jgi:hypothetical protein